MYVSVCVFGSLEVGIQSGPYMVCHIFLTFFVSSTFLYRRLFFFI